MLRILFSLRGMDTEGISGRLAVEHSEQAWHNQQSAQALQHHVLVAQHHAPTDFPVNAQVMTLPPGNRQQNAPPQQGNETVSSSQDDIIARAKYILHIK